MHTLKKLHSGFQSDEDVGVEGKIRHPFPPRWNSRKGAVLFIPPLRESYEYSGSADDQDHHENGYNHNDQHYYHCRDYHHYNDMEGRTNPSRKEEDLESEEGASKWDSHADRANMPEGDTCDFQDRELKNPTSGLRENVKRTKLKMCKNLIEKREIINCRNFFQIPFEENKRASKHQQVHGLSMDKNKCVGSPSKLSTHLRVAKLVRSFMKEKKHSIIPSKESLHEQRSPNSLPERISPSVESSKEAASMDTRLDNPFTNRIGQKLSKKTYRFNCSSIHICTFKCVNDNYVRFFRRRLMKSKIHALMKMQGEEMNGIFNPFMRILLKYETPFMWKTEISHQNKHLVRKPKEKERGNAHPYQMGGTGPLTNLIKERNSSGTTSNMSNLSQEGNFSSDQSAKHRDGLINKRGKKKTKEQSIDVPLVEQSNGQSPVTQWSTAGGIVDSYLNENANFFEQNFLEEDFCVGSVSKAPASDANCYVANPCDADPCEVDLSLDESIKTLISNCNSIFNNHSSNPPQEFFISQANETEARGARTSSVKLHPQNYDEINLLNDDCVMNIKHDEEEKNFPRRTNPKGVKCQLVKGEKPKICDDFSGKKKHLEEEKERNNFHEIYLRNSRRKRQINFNQFDMQKRGEDAPSKEFRPNSEHKEELYIHPSHDTHKGDKICALKKLHKNVKDKHSLVLLPVRKKEHLKRAFSDQKNTNKDEGEKKNNFSKMMMKTYPNFRVLYTYNCRLHKSAFTKRKIRRKKNNKKDNEIISYFRFYKKNLLTMKGEKKKCVSSHGDDNCNKFSVTPTQNVIPPCGDYESTYHLEEEKEKHQVPFTFKIVQESVEVTTKGKDKQNHISRQANHNVEDRSRHTSTPEGNNANGIYVNKKDYKEEINSIKGEGHSQNGFTPNGVENKAHTSPNGEALQESPIKNDHLTTHTGNKDNIHLRGKKGIDTYGNHSSGIFTLKNRMGSGTFQGEDPLPGSSLQNANKIDNAILEEHSSDMGSFPISESVHEIKLNFSEGHVFLYFYGENGTQVLQFSIELDLLEQNCKLFKGLSESSGIATNSGGNINSILGRNTLRSSPRSVDQYCSDLPIDPTKVATLIIQKEDIIKSYCNRLALSEEKQEHIHRTISNSLSVENFTILFTLLKMKKKMNILLLQINKITGEIKKLLIMIEKKLEEIESLTPKLEFLRNAKKEAKVTVIQNCMNFFLRITSIYSNICTLIKTQNGIFSHFKFNNEIINSYLFFVKKFSTYISRSVVEIQNFYVQIKNMQNEQTDQNCLNRQEKSILKKIHKKLENHLSIHYKKIFIFKQILEIYLIELKNFKKYQKDYMISKINILINYKCPYDLLLFSILVKSKSLCEISVRKICHNFDITNFQTNKRIYALFINKKIKNNILKKIKANVGGNAYVTLKNIFFYNELNGLMKNALRNGGCKTGRHLSQKGEETLEGNPSDEGSMESPQEGGKSPRNLIDASDICNIPSGGKNETAEMGNLPKGGEEIQNDTYEKHDGDVCPTGRNQPSESNYELMEESNESVPSNVTTNNLSTCSSLNDCEDSKYLQNIGKILKTNNALTLVKNIRRSLDIDNLCTSNKCSVENKNVTYKSKCSGEKKSKLSIPSNVQTHISRFTPKNEENYIKLNCARKKKKKVENKIDQLRKVFKTYEGERKEKGEKDSSRKNGSIENADWKTHQNGRRVLPPRHRRTCCKYNPALMDQLNPSEQLSNTDKYTIYNKKEKKKRKILENIEKIKEIEKNYKQVQEIERQEEFKKKLNEWKMKKITKRNNINLLKIRGLRNNKKDLFTSFVKKDINRIGTIIRCKINGERDICTDVYTREVPSNHTESCSSHLISMGGKKSVEDILDNLKNSTPACTKIEKSDPPFGDLNGEEGGSITHQEFPLHDHITKFDNDTFDRNHLNGSSKNRHNGILNFEGVEKEVVKRVSTSQGVTNPVNDKIIINEKTGRNLKKGNTNCEDEDALDDNKEKEYILHQTEEHFTDSFFKNKLYEPSPSETHFFTAIEDDNEHTDIILSPRQSKKEPKRCTLRVSNGSIKYNLSDYTQKWNRTERIPSVCTTKGDFSPSEEKGSAQKKVTGESHNDDCTNQQSEVSREGNYFPRQEDEEARVSKMTNETLNEWFNRRKKKTLHQMVSGKNNAPFVRATLFPIEVKHKITSKIVSSCGRKKPSYDFHIGGNYRTKESIERRRRIDNYAKTLRTLGPLENMEMSLKNIKNVPSKVKRKNIIEFLRRRQREGMASNHLIYKDEYVFLKKNMSSKF
ncbi:conserved Plasmodium protein, unknown function [Plasmodium knowlesi strain H]|uniref:Uncharacterized protein n=3 Tax=Plasmodium knowlesi TaxID=5850 RepID=A0A5K1UM83_PLAKH|nr:conserved Plasmodium protein, unknown function [Plasmodium knowlesi strain H]OTN64886.1 Uncharacterized protein PKNOH_S120157100 [Plasmodium knowlesi]CAA9988427.1 conserved Plasmodium protein, unknown function [Plasmodium knowlesi strain H]SBO19886.1 conserved Plasmodium protein, unknown function [Plasmodium knowlesi strain H]SBO20408.1 conserved Plasmodium protein, unknown function [Plasmodium knowlesi strain H]VVS77901.1 conserved Plasmodium protein, unknown function [Plasmodium knowlesi |eukprot:XP_002259408.1 hypothetical protein, conserved in Plasmodium species [Plasmodium knowlesi strain H]